ncbi:MAG: replicative DNA helicase, partial [Proteobacteria bacterium]|nr:replicative DNA helicase [Pseudomonadota bacterium]
DGKLTGISTGFTKLDEMTSGLQPGDLIVVAGRPSMGKTTLAVNIAENAALGAGKSAAIFSMEMSSESLTMRMISSLGRINQAALRSGRLTEDDWPRIDTAMNQLSSARLYVDETPALTPTEVRARARRLKRERGLDLIVVDYLQLMQVSGTKENRATEISEISRALKALAKELSVPVIALSQLNRGVEQRVEKKPVMSDLRECVTGDTPVWLADGQRVPIRELVGRTPQVWAMDADQKIIAARSDRIWSVGHKAVFRITLASGRSLTATASHRLFTSRGWQEVADIGPGDQMGLARRVPALSQPVRWSEDRIVLLGHLLAAGRFARNSIRYATRSQVNGEAVARAARRLGGEAERLEGAGPGLQYLISEGGAQRRRPAGAGRWMAALGFGETKAELRQLPPEVFQFDDEQIGHLLKHLWAAGGCIQVRDAMAARSGVRVSFSCLSERLAQQVAALLLRLGITARGGVTQPRSGHIVYSIDVSGADAQRLFLARIGAFGPWVVAAQRLTEQLMPQGAADAESPRLRRATGGAAARALAVEAPETEAAGEPSSDTSPGGSATDLAWDRVVAVEPCGVEEVFDLTVPGPCSWLADGIVSHNSGAIEQDADLILLIYREEVYEPNTTRKGIADIIIAKQRNGPIGDVQLTFLGQYTKFENFAPESYSEGVL